MATEIQSVNFTADKKLIEKAEQKIDKLNTFHDKIIDVEVYMKLDNVVHNIKDKVVEIKVHVPGKTYFTKSESKKIEDAFESAYEAMANKLKTEKQMQVSNSKRSNHKNQRLDLMNQIDEVDEAEVLGGE